jgi:hypothetical protein
VKLYARQLLCLGRLSVPVAEVNILKVFDSAPAEAGSLSIHTPCGFCS